MRTRRLDRLPRLMPLDARAAAGLIPGASRLPFVGGGGAEVPDLRLSVEGLRIDAGHLERYRRVCGYPPSDHLPPTYLHAVAFPLHLALLTHPDAPFRAVGLVHMENEVTCRRPVGRDERLDLRAHLTGLEPHPRGQSFLIVTEALQAGEPVWEERCTIIRRLAEGRRSEGGSEDEDEASDPSEVEAADAPTVGAWNVPASIGFRYAVASGDHNPIHVHSLAARVSGLPGVVAPGMWTKARALAAMHDALPEAMTVEVEFRRPIVLPAEVELGVVEDGGRHLLAVREREAGKPYVTGAVRPT